MEIDRQTERKKLHKGKNKNKRRKGDRKNGEILFNKSKFFLNEKSHIAHISNNNRSTEEEMYEVP